MALLRFFTCCLLLAAGAVGLSQVTRPDGARPTAGVVVSNSSEARLTPTAHAPLPTQPSQAWLAPVEASERRLRSTEPYRSLVAGVERLRESSGPLREGPAEAGRHVTGAVTLINPASFAGTELADYAEYYAGVAQLRAERPEQARQTLGAIRARRPQSYVYQAAAMREADAAEAQKDFAAARRIYEELTQAKLLDGEVVWFRLGRTALATGDRAKAAEAFARVYYEFPLADVAAPAATELASLSDVRASASSSRAVLDLEIGRAERLYGARRYAAARAAFEPLRGLPGGDQRELVDVRLAECDFYLGRYAAARDGMRPYLERASRVAEARFFYLTALREVGAVDEFITRTRDLARDFPDSSWTEEALNNLAAHYLKGNDDAAANETFRQLYTQFPGGRRAERAGWKVGWWAYRNGQHAEAIRVFESVAAQFPRSDFRPPVLYWAARAHDKLGARALATERYTLVAIDYLNSYYGRLAAKALKARREPVPAPGRPAAVLPPPTMASSASSPTGVPAAAAMPPTHALIRRLLALGLYDDALLELQYAQRVWGTSPVIEATLAYVYYQQGDLRRAITVMKRAYPQFLTSDGERLPPDVLKVMFPLDYWDIIRRHSAAHDLDPYVIAALVAQESTFVRDIRSPANAYGLMQIIPATGRRLARQVGIPRFTTAMLTTAETNVRLGTLYFAGLVDRFGGAHHALASYNAGENRIARWIAERPGLEQDEFIDDIPFPETQNYVKRVLGTAEDYRRLYGELGLSPRVDSDTRILAGTVVPPEPAPPRRRAGKGKAKKPALKKRAPTKKPATKKPATKKPARRR